MNALHQPSFKRPAAPAVADIATAVMNGVQCLDTSGLAALLGCAPHHVRHHLGHRLDFPAPFIDLSPRLRYWRVIDVLQWLYQPGMRALSVADLGAPRLDVAGIADLLGCSRQHATAVIAKRKDFPPPCINVSNRMRTWLYRDVLAWLAPQGAEFSSGGHAAAPAIVDADGVAQMLGCTREHFTERLLRQAGFPQPFLYASRRLRWWRVSDVLAWQQKGGAA
ncbi:helix-turn-helix transcriptional regulator [Comamonas testosteroni]|uniref:helix-turn-helix transcriptional regulator n=1 Tax=Comamonas testosteroni TaxID=285 RepID=UPI00391C8A5A